MMNCIVPHPPSWKLYLLCHHNGNASPAVVGTTQVEICENDVTSIHSGSGRLRAERRSTKGMWSSAGGLVGRIDRAGRPDGCCLVTRAQHCCLPDHAGCHCCYYPPSRHPAEVRLPVCVFIVVRGASFRATNVSNWSVYREDVGHDCELKVRVTFTNCDGRYRTQPWGETEELWLGKSCQYSEGRRPQNPAKWTQTSSTM